MNLQSEFGDALEFMPAENAIVSGATPQFHVAPRDEDCARALVHFCGRQKLALICIGNGTKLEIGAPPARYDVGISTRYLNQIFDHDAGNATIEAGAGVSLGDLNAAVADAKQFVPLDDDGGTLGGAVACNAFGPSKLKWGAPRDLVVGLHALLSDGRHVKGGAKVVKNVAGYDLPKLFVGSFGTLGLMARVTVRLRPRDAATADWCERFDSLAELETRAGEVTNGPFEPTRLRASWSGESWILRARFEGGERAVAAQLARLPATEVVDEARWTPLEWDWQLRAQLPLMRAADWLRAAQPLAAQFLQWDCGLGLARADFARAIPASVNYLRALAEAEGGYVRVNRAPLEHKTSELVWGTGRADASLMRALKSAYDVAGVRLHSNVAGQVKSLFRFLGYN